MRDDTPIARLLPWHVRSQLVDAAKARDVKRIDAITDVLAFQGIVRARKDDSMFASKGVECAIPKLVRP